MVFQFKAYESVINENCNVEDGEHVGVCTGPLLSSRILLMIYILRSLVYQDPGVHGSIVCIGSYRMSIINSSTP